MKEQGVSKMTKVWEQDERFTLTEAKKLLKSQILPCKGVNNESRDACKCILLVGEHSVGKTRIVEQACEEVGVEMIKFHFGATEQEDNAGRQYLDDAYKLTRRAVPEHLPCFYRPPKSKTGLGVMFFDETMSGYSGHQTVLRMMIDRKLVDIDIQPGWTFVGSTNPPTIDYASIQEAEESLSGRFIYLPVEGTADEYLAYWSKHMPPKVYEFLLLTHINGMGFVREFGAREWFNFADTVERALRLTDEKGDRFVDDLILAKLCRINHSKDVGAEFFAFLKHGNNPDCYPIRYKMFLDADEVEWKVCLNRIKQWTSKNEVPLLGATKWDLVNFLRDPDQAEVTKANKKLTRRVAEFAIALSDGNKADIVGSLIQGCKDKPIFQTLLPEIRGTSVEKRFIEIYQADEQARQAERDRQQQ